MISLPHALSALMVMGVAWAVTIPLMKVAVSTGHHFLGLIFWQMVIVAVVTGGILGFQKKQTRFTRPFINHCIIIALIGTLLPNTFSYISIVHLPAGIMAIIIATVPMYALLIALTVKAEAFNLVRFIGVALGIIAVAILTGPNDTLPQPEKVGYVFLALLGPFCYGLESNYVAWRAMKEYSAIQVIFGASIVGILVLIPVVWAPAIWVDLSLPWGNPELALILSSVIHALVYAGYIWLVHVTSAVFASQISYVVTLSGVFISALMLQEQYSHWAYLALGFMMAGLFLVQPRAYRPEKSS